MFHSVLQNGKQIKPNSNYVICISVAMGEGSVVPEQRF
jgi:hypothetical protein